MGILGGNGGDELAVDIALGGSGGHGVFSSLSFDVLIIPWDQRSVKLSVCYEPRRLMVEIDGLAVNFLPNLLDECVKPCLLCFDFLFGLGDFIRAHAHELGAFDVLHCFPLLSDYVVIIPHQYTEVNKFF